MFPTKEYLSLCTQPEVAEMLRGLWEPKAGDWFMSSTSDISGIAWWEDPVKSIEEERAEPANYDGVFWLPRIDQLRDLLEERGKFISLDGPLEGNPEERYVVEYEPPGLRPIFYAPDPASALLLALVGVMKDE